MTALNERIDQLEKQVGEYNLTKKGLESKVNLLTQKLASEGEIGRKKIEKLQQDVNALTMRNHELKEETEKAREDMQRSSIKYEDTFGKLKDLMFEKNDLDLKYTQSLAVVEN